MNLVVVLGLAGWPVAAVALAWTLACCRARAARRESVARACHELRGPVTAARLGLALIGRRGDAPTAKLRAIDLELSCAALALDDLASGSGAGTWVGAGASSDSERRSEPQLVHIPELLADCVEASRAGAHARGVRLESSWSGATQTVWGERVRLAQATRNLVANAIEHGGGPVLVRGHGDGDVVRIEVTDDGSGLPSPVAELVRRPRGGRGTRGRGLAIAATIAERHGGRLAASPSDRGARLVLELPSAADAGQAIGRG